jgi:hypothetical protein
MQVIPLQVHADHFNIQGRTPIQFDDLPIAAQNGFSFDQLTYIDEFSFYWKDGLIECHYAEVCEGVWDGHCWSR